MSSILPRRSSLLGGLLCAVVGLIATTAQANPAPVLERAYAAKADGRLTEAREAFQDAARLEGATGQLASLELGYLAAAAGDLVAARRYYAIAESSNANLEVSRRARAELDAMAPPTTTKAPPPATPLPPPEPAPVVNATPVPETSEAALEEAYRAKAAGDSPGAVRAFERALALGADRQRISMELGYIEAANGDPAAARARFHDAEQGADADIGARARREGSSLPQHFSADGYADSFGWSRVSNTAAKSAVVPTLRVRAFLRPALTVPFELYVAGQATRDTGSRGYAGSALPQLFSDNYAIVSAGARYRFWGGRIETFAQIGQAFDLVQNDGRPRTALDVRGGGLLYAETAGCTPPGSTTRFGLWPCLEAYGEVVYVNRFQNDVIGFARPRAALGYLETGPVLWQGVVEARSGKDLNNDYWNNFVDGGIGQRWRLLRPFRLDLLVSANAGTYFGSPGAPSSLGYVDGRALATTYVVF